MIAEYICDQCHKAWKIQDYGETFPIYFDYNEQYDGFSEYFPTKEATQPPTQSIQSTDISNTSSTSNVSSTSNTSNTSEAEKVTETEVEKTTNVHSKTTTELFDVARLKKFIADLSSIYPPNNPELLHARIVLLRYYIAIQVHLFIIE